MHRVVSDRERERERERKKEEKEAFGARVYTHRINAPRPRCQRDFLQLGAQLDGGI